MTTCLQDCLGYMLNIHPGFIPDFGEHNEYWYDYMEWWLYDALGVSIERVRADMGVSYHEIHIEKGLSPRGTYHAIVVQGGRILLDPHNSGAGLARVDWRYFITDFFPAARWGYNFESANEEIAEDRGRSLQPAHVSANENRPSGSRALWRAVISGILHSRR